MAEAADTQTLSQRMRFFTREIHDKSDNAVNKQLAIALTDRALYGQAISLFYPIYKEIEALLDDNKDHRSLHPIMKYMPVLARAWRFEADLAFYLGPNWQLDCDTAAGLPAVSEYVQHLRAIAKADPKRLIAYAYHMYLAIFAGGSMTKKMARRTMGLPEGQGTCIFDFETGDMSNGKFRSSFKETIDTEVARTLQEAEVVDLLQESHQVFERNNKVTGEFKGGFAVLFRKVAKASVVVIAATGTLMLIYRSLKQRTSLSPVRAR